MGSLGAMVGKMNCHVCNGCFYNRCKQFGKDFEMFKVGREHQSRITILIVSYVHMDKGKVDLSFDRLIVGFVLKCQLYKNRIHENVDVVLCRGLFSLYHRFCYPFGC